MKSSAILSTDRRYRFVLMRSWAEVATIPKTMIIVGLNPSTADEKEDDPTIRRCVGFAKREACTQLLMLNLFAYRSVEPNVLYDVKKPVGSRNNSILEKYASWPNARHVVAWGAHPLAVERGRFVAQLMRGNGAKLECFGVTKDGAPKHPLYLAAETPLVPYAG